MMRAVLLAGAALSMFAVPAAAETVLIDLTHPIPTFHSVEGDPYSPDLNRPWGDSRPVPSFGQQTVLNIAEFPVGDGHFDLGTLVLAEHHVTHMDMPGHFIPNEQALEAGNSAQGRLAHESTAEDLFGPVVMIDIADRVHAELAKNGGVPSPDVSVTDFSNASVNVVGPEDIDAVADQLADGVWLVLNLGWSAFFEDADFQTSPYINGWNHPGLSRAGVDRLIEVMDERGIKINGIVADNIGIDSGESAIGENGNWTNSWHGHLRLLQRDLKFVENATNLDVLAATTGECRLFVGALKHTRGTGGAARVVALCES